MLNSRTRAMGILVGLLVLAVPVTLAEDRVVPGIGDAVPEWSDLPGTDGQRHSLADLADHTVMIVCFTCNTCPYAIDYEDRLLALHRRYQQSAASVALVAINSNAVAADHLDRMKDRAKEKPFDFLYLRDDDQQVARSWGALYTPEFFVLNKDRRIVYKGALDDNTDAGKVQVKYVELAVDAVVQGTDPEVTKTAPRGCLIRFPRQRRSP